MNRVLIPFTEDKRPDVEPIPAWGYWNDERDIFVRCGCGQITSIGRHTVEPNGDVNPSLYHAEGEGACGWHVFGTLESYGLGAPLS